MPRPVEKVTPSKLIFDVLDTLPTTVTGIDYPKHGDGCWWLDFIYQQRKVVVQWHAKGRYYEVSSVTSEGEPCRWATTNYYRTYARVLKLLAFGDV